MATFDSPYLEGQLSSHDGATVQLPAIKQLTPDGINEVGRVARHSPELHVELVML